MTNNLSLFELFKSHENGNVFKWHHYLPIYEEFFKSYVGKPIKILEIGVLEGGSLHIWKKYFGKECQVYGVDINAHSKQFEADRIHIRIGDQSDPKFLAKLIEETGGFDIVIDDGAHTNYMVSKSFESLFASTRILYIVEDTHALLWWGGLYSLGRDIQFAICSGKPIIKKIIHLCDLLKKFLFGKLNFTKYAQRQAKRLTSEWHPTPLMQISQGQAKVVDAHIVSSFAKSVKSVAFYDSLIIFQKEDQSNRVVEFR